MYAYKATEKGLKCRGYQFLHGEINRTKEANCVKNGFHCALNPLDCFTYYPNIEDSEYWLVEVGGDVDEDDRDSKISCTELRFLRQLTPGEMAVHGMVYLIRHPEKIDEYTKESTRSYIIRAGDDPVVNTKHRGVIIGVIKYLPNGDVGVAAVYVDGKTVKPGIYDYDRIKAIDSGRC